VVVKYPRLRTHPLLLLLLLQLRMLLLLLCPSMTLLPTCRWNGSTASVVAVWKAQQRRPLSPTIALWLSRTRSPTARRRRGRCCGGTLRTMKATALVVGFITVISDDSIRSSLLIELLVRVGTQYC